MMFPQVDTPFPGPPIHLAPCPSPTPAFSPYESTAIFPLGLSALPEAPTFPVLLEWKTIRQHCFMSWASLAQSAGG